ncbi:hypothetical protein, partial [Aeromonas sp. ASNIH8]|uniref:hypothetical protein n=1 Tax=Aeromonas sp. ASNIH8 TaxID=1920113 RepID=UPI001CA5D100
VCVVCCLLDGIFALTLGCVFFRQKTADELLSGLVGPMPGWFVVRLGDTSKSPLYYPVKR